MPLEKQADIVIADHARAKYAPEGSASWKFITESVETGELKDLDEYIIADTSASKTAMKSPGNAVGNSAPMKMTRMPYTQEDDKFLRKWVANALKAGGSARGNVIYQELEKAVRIRINRIRITRWLTSVRTTGIPPTRGAIAGSRGSQAMRITWINLMSTRLNFRSESQQEPPKALHGLRRERMKRRLRNPLSRGNHCRQPRLRL